MATNGDEVRKAAMAELARRELARRQQTAPAQRTVGQQVKRDAGLGARSVYNAVASLPNMVHDVPATISNLATRAFYPGGYDVTINGKKERRTGLVPMAGEQQNAAMSAAGLPTPQTGMEKASDIATQFMTGMLTSGPVNKAVLGMAGLPSTPPAVNAPRAPSAASTEAAQTLETAGVPLDEAQRTGGRFSNLLRSAVKDHPFTSQGIVDFAEKQQKSFNRAVLRSIGASADEATQEVMSEARGAISKVFNEVGKNGAAFDDTLQSELAQIVNNAQRTVVESELKPLMTNIDDILNAVDDAGRISGEQFISIRSNLSDLAKTPGVGPRAADAEQALLSALERTYPGQRAILREAIDKYRNLKIIEPAISKGTTANISPVSLSNAIGSARNRAMSLYGRGGDQGLVSLAKAGREVLPEVLPQSGSIPRGMMQAPLRAVATAPLYKAGLAALLSKPPPPAAGYGVRAAAIPGANNALAAWLAQRNGAR